MSQEKLVSVIIPLYNCEDRILRCVSSVLNQTYKNIEVIVIDDGSTDNSLEVLRNGISDPRLQIYTQQNHGVSYTRNRGIDIALSNDTDGWITFVDSDDYLEDDALMICLSEHITNEIDYIHFGRVLKKNVGIVNQCDFKEKIVDNIEAFSLFMQGWIDRKLVKGNWLTFVTGGLFRKSIINKNKIRFCESINRNEDAMFSLQYFDFCKKILLLNYPKYIWVQQKNSLSSVCRKSVVFDDIKIFPILWAMVLYRIEHYKSECLYEIYASWIICMYNIFLNNSAKVNLTYDEVKVCYNTLVSQVDILNIVYKQKLKLIHEKIARLMLKSRSAFISYVVIKAMSLLNGYWRVK